MKKRACDMHARFGESSAARPYLFNLWFLAALAREASGTF